MRVIKVILGVICSFLSFIWIITSIATQNALWLIGTAVFLIPAILLFRKTKKDKEKAMIKANKKQSKNIVNNTPTTPITNNIRLETSEEDSAEALTIQDSEPLIDEPAGSNTYTNQPYETSIPLNRPSNPPKKHRAKKGCIVFLSIVGAATIGFIVLVIVLACTLGKDVQPPTQPGTQVETQDNFVLYTLADCPVKVNSYYSTEPNSADGVSVYIDWYCENTKEIKYIYFDVTPYNRVDDKQYCEIRYYSTRTCSLTGPFSEGSADCSYWDCVWYNRDIDYIVLNSISIEYMDGTSQVYFG